jgi:uncharacterized protein (DUF111 family)
MRIGYLECFSGISGDMLLGALVDAGVPFESLAQTAEALNVGARLERRKVMRGGITGTKVDVISPEGQPESSGHSHGDHGKDHSHDDAHEHSHDGHSHSHEAHSHSHAAEPAHKQAEHSHAPHRHLSSILKIIEAAPLSDAVKARASRAFRLLGEAEAGIHSIPVEKVHFHEVGAVDTIVDIVCSAVGAELLGVDLECGQRHGEVPAWNLAGARARHAGAAWRCAGLCCRSGYGTRNSNGRGDFAHA